MMTQLRTGHVGEEQNTFVESELEQLVAKLSKDSNTDAQWKRRVPKQQHVPQVKYLVQWKHIC